MSQDDPSAPITGTIDMGGVLKQAEQQSEATGEPHPHPKESPTEPVIDQAREESPSPDAEEKTSLDESKTGETEFVSGSKKAREIGERQKTMAKTLMETAKQSSSALAMLQNTVSGDPTLEKYMKNHFPKDFAKLMKADPLNYEPETDVEPEEVDAEAIKMQAKAEMLAEQLKLQKEDEAEEYAAKLGFTMEEAEELKDLASSLEGRSYSGKKLDHTAALKRAAVAIRGDKAQAGLVNIQGGGPKANSAKIEKEVELDVLASAGKKLSGRNPDDIKKNLKIIDENLKDNVFTMPME